MKKLLWIFVMVLGFNAFATEYYVSLKGNNMSDGLTEATAWRTITYAATKAKAGDTVWIKSGDYGKENVVVKNNGIKGNPISFIGYKNKPGDITSMYYTYAKGKTLDPSEMPLLDGGDRGINTGIYFNKKGYIVLKNIQATNYSKIISGSGSNNLILNNVIVKGAGATDLNPGEKGYGIIFGGDNSHNNLIKNSISINATQNGILIYGDNNVVDNCKVIADENDDLGKHVAMDYYIILRGNNNNVKNCFINRVGNLKHHGHGISLKSAGIKTEKNLIENCTIINVKGAIELRHSDVKNNKIKEVKIVGPIGAIVIRDGANNNIVENSIIKDTNEGLRFYDQTEDGQGGIVASNNIVRNTIFQNIGTAIVSTKSKNVSKIGFIANNSIQNCTFINIDNLFFGGLPMDETNIITNSIFANIKSYEKKSKYSPKWVSTYSNYFNNGFNKPSGTGNIGENPQFEDVAKGNFRLKPSSKLIDAGKEINTVKTDFDGNNRPQGKSHDIGAFEFQENSTTINVKANAGEDQSICLGDSVTLTASGGSTYKWNTGETTKSITVNPTDTTTYSVTVSEGSASDIDEVVVTVNNVTAEAGSNKTIEEGDSITLTATGGDTYKWNTGETAESITVSPNSTTTYSVTATKGNCEDTDEVKVTVNPKQQGTISANAGEDESICLGEKVTLTASGGSRYEWNTGATTKSINVKPTETTTYSVTVSKGNVTDSDEVTVTVNSVTANAGSNKNIDEGESVILTASGGNSYKWNTGETTKNITVSPNKTTEYSVTVVKGNCEDTDKVKVTVNSKQKVSVTAKAGEDQSICLGETVTLTASGGSSYKWNTGATTKSITVNPVETTTYNVTVSEGSASDSDEVHVTVNNIKADAGSNKSIEEGESVILTATGGDSYKWNTGETTESITVSPNKTTEYSVTVTKGDCEDADEVKVTVNSKQQVSVRANAGEDQTICFGETVTLTASGGSSYKWSTGDTTKSITVNPNKTTNYTVTVSEGNASDSDNVTVTVNSLIADAGSNKTIEEGESVTLTATGGDSYKWNTGETTQSITVSPGKTKIYSVTVTKNYGCEDTDSVQVTVDQSLTSNPPPVNAEAGENIKICLGESTTLTANGGDSYIWSTGDTNKTISVNPVRTTTYTLEATRGGVTNKDTVTVIVENCSISSDIEGLENDLKVYPNPSTGTINVAANNSNESLNLDVINLNGSLVYSEKVTNKYNAFEKQLDLSRLAKGVYIVRLYNSNYNDSKKIILY